MLNQIHEFGLNIHLIGLRIDQDINKGNEIIMNVTTYPEHCKATFSFPVKESDQINHVFVLNVHIQSKNVNEIIAGQAESIHFSIISRDKLRFERKIATARILPQDIPKISNNAVIYDNVKFIKIYKTSKDFYKDKKNGLISKYEISDHNTIKRQSIGEMQVQLSLCKPYCDVKPIIKKESNKKKGKNDFHSSSDNISLFSKEKSFKNKASHKSVDNNQYEIFYY